MNKNELTDNMLESVIGGSITFYPDTPGAKTGKIGINQNYTHRYNDQAAVDAYISAHMNDNKWTSVEERDQYLLQGMISAGIIF